MKKLIVNGDDYGLNEHNSKAIAQAFAEGLISSATMMANGEYFEQAVELARERGFIGSIGIHLNLTEGEPLTEDIKRCPRFVTDGRFNKKYNRTHPLRSDEKSAIEKELSAQVGKISGAGIKITHADDICCITSIQRIKPLREFLITHHTGLLLPSTIKRGRPPFSCIIPKIFLYFGGTYYISAHFFRQAKAISLNFSLKCAILALNRRREVCLCISVSLAE